MKRSRLSLTTVLLVTCFGMLFCGCEGDNGGSPGDGHDFADNNAGVYVAFGDSITYGAGLSASDSYPSQLGGILGAEVINAGVPGRLASEGASSVSSTLSRYKPGYLLVLFGANDIIHGRSNDATVEHLRTIVQAAKNNKTIPVIGTLTPTYGTHSFMQGSIADINPKIRQMASEEGALVANLNGAFGSNEALLQSDGLHPTAEGAGVIAQNFAGVLQ